MILENRSIVITGASQGLGKKIAQLCIAEGAHVLLCARDAGVLSETRSALAALARPGQVVLAARADVSRPGDVERMFDIATSQLPGLHGLINNAGVYGPLGRFEETNWDEWRSAMEINLFGMALTCRKALPVFRQNGYGKIVNLSGGGATAPLPRISAYAASKAAVVRLTETLAEENRDKHIDANAVAPGALNTRLLDEVLAAGPESVGADFYQRAAKQKETGGATLETGASLCAFLVSSQSDGITGRLISAVWDPWRDLPGRIGELNSTDIYTLRRIIPSDRGLDW
ncbi:MAG: SDR family oxidoreductase [Bryobacteraceae bacterium]